MLKVKKLHPDAKLPTVAHPGTDLGYDLYSLDDCVVSSGPPTKVRTGIAIEFTNELMGCLMRDRSSMALRGIYTAGGTIDAGYRGELIVMLHCGYGVEPYCIVAGDKIAQLLPILSMTQMLVQHVNDLSPAERGEKGFGSSGR